MSISYNKVILVGRTTRTPEVKMSAELTKVVTFDLAVSRSFGDGETDFFNCVAFGKLADTIASYVRKGELILVEGRIEIDKWVDKSGINREKPKIYVSSFRFLETKSSKEENTNMNENVFEE
ncbi:MAG: single-stranded DNA-binding protein, partial [Defluviitoga tunisiensis]